MQASYRSQQSECPSATKIKAQFEIYVKVITSIVGGQYAASPYGVFVTRIAVLECHKNGQNF